MWLSWPTSGSTMPGRAVQGEMRADEHELGPRREEQVQEVLRERHVDLVDARRCNLAPVEARVVDVDVEAVLVRRVLVQRPAAETADVADHEPRCAGVRLVEGSCVTESSRWMSFALP